MSNIDIIGMAWADRVSFEEIKKKTGFNEKEVIKIMNGLPVTVRLLDPPLHEFLPKTDKDVENVARELNMSNNDIKSRIIELHEQNPMLGHRGCRLGISFPEIYQMQCQAIFEALAECKKKKIKLVIPEIMIPLVSTAAEIEILKNFVFNIII